MTDTTPDHRIVWNEVHVSDLDAAAEFYGRLFGWAIREEERDTYLHFYLGDEAVAGLVSTSQDDPGGGAPPMWQVYVGTTDIEGYAERARAAGQTELTPLIDIPHTGKLQILADAEGAILAPFQATGADLGGGASGEPGHFCWVELHCRDQAAMVAHYREVVGWETFDMDVGDRAYTMFVPPGGGQMDAVGGSIQMPPEASGPSAWLPYVSVTDVDAISAQVRELGGRVHVEATDIGDKGRFSVLVDPQGATFAVWRSSAASCEG